MALPGDWALRDAAGAEDPRLLCSDCEGIKAKGFLFWGAASLKEPAGVI